MLRISRWLWIPFLVITPPGLLSAQAGAEVHRGDLHSHYQRVEAELRAAPQPCDPALAASRAAAIDLLREYRERGDFGQNFEFPGQRQPYFVDRDGRRCAVAYLMDRTGKHALVLEIAAARNHAWVAELIDDPRLQQWLQQQGLSAAEAARIQAPGRTGEGGGTWRMMEPPMMTPPPPPPVQSGPGDVVGSSPVLGGNARLAAAVRSMPLGSTLNGTASADAGMPLDSLESPGWLDWWSWNRLELLPPRRLAVSIPGNQTVAIAAEDVAVRAALRLGLSAADARERAAAVLALGRLGGDAARLRDCLDDSDQRVQVAAILGLGSDGGLMARHILVASAAARIATRPYALLAMAGLRDLDRATEVVAIAKSALRGDEQQAAAAAVLARALANDELRQQATAWESAASVVERARLVESLSRREDGRILGRLTTALSARSPDVRRSAAWSLARTRHDLALPVLLTAFELERELATKQVLLLAIGSHGGMPGVALVEEQLLHGKKPLRSFAALSLGLLARQQALPLVAARLRQAFESERNHEHAGAYLLALGLAGDHASLPLLRQTLRNGADATARAMAAEALALLQAVAELPLLQHALQSDSCPFVRAAVAGAIGNLGNGAEHATALAEAASRDPDNSVRTAAAFALGAFGSDAARRELLQLVRSEDVATRAGAMSGLGRLLRARSTLVGAGLTAAANSSLWPDWLRWALAQEF